MTKSIIFYHCFFNDKSLNLLEHTLNLFIKTNLYNNINKIYVNINNIEVCNSTLNAIYERCPDLLKNKLLIFNIKTDPKSERDTLHLLYNVCVGLPDSYNILYLHSKGASVSKDRLILPVQSWRKMMEYFLIERWNEATSYLPTHGACGACKNNNLFNHFSGNFWWTTTKFIKLFTITPTIKASEFWQQSMLHIKSGKSKLYSESWILQMNPNSAKCLFQTPLDLYNNVLQESYYRDEKDII